MAHQHDLFERISEPPPAIPGLQTVRAAITPALAEELAGRIDAAPLQPFRFGQWTGKRMTCSYGSGYDYQRGRLADAPPIPDWLLTLRERLAPLVGRDAEAFGQALLIRYDPGAGIGWHRDRPQYGEVMGLSLGAPAVLRLRRRTDIGFERRMLTLEPCGLYLLSGAVRREWEHSIVPQERTRRSVTFRTLL